MKIGLLTHSTLPRGGVVHVLELGRALLARGHEVTVFAPAAPGETLFRATPCRLSLAPYAPAGGGFAATVRQRIVAMREHLGALPDLASYEIFHAHDGIGANALADLQEAGRIAGYLRTVHHVDRFPDDDVQAWEARSIRAAARVLCVSTVWQQKLLTTQGVEAQTVPNGVDLDRFTPAPRPGDVELAATLGLAPRGARVLVVGGIEARKNTGRLLAGFVQWRREWRPDAQLIVAGGASLLPHDAARREFHEAARSAGLAIGPGEPIVLTGALPDDTMPALYREADVLAMPSLIEGFGLAALEALACGTPVVVSALAPFTEHFRDDDVAWCDPLQPESIAVALARALQRGRRPEPPAVCRRYSWAASAARHEAVFRDVLDSRPNPHARDALPAALAG